MIRRIAPAVAAAAAFTLLTVPGAPAFMGADMKGSGAGKTTPASKLAKKIEKARGADAYSVEELHEKAGALSGKAVSVRGQVVKVSEGIMGKNWVHLQDGTGNAGKGTHDITVTTQDIPRTGDVVTAKGTLRKDKDFGAGYLFAVILEDAAVKP